MKAGLPLPAVKSQLFSGSTRTVRRPMKSDCCFCRTGFRSSLRQRLSPPRDARGLVTPLLERQRYAQFINEFIGECENRFQSGDASDGKTVARAVRINLEALSSAQKGATAFRGRPIGVGAGHRKKTQGGPARAPCHRAKAGTMAGKEQRWLGGGRKPQEPSISLQVSLERS
jgi:hypothetical protein